VSAFTDLDFQRIDVTAIVTFGGLATIDEKRHKSCREWLKKNDYAIDTLDCRQGLADAVTELGKLLRWEKQFGHELESDSRDVDVLREGFEFEISEGGGRVLEILRPDQAWREDPAWLRGLLSMIQEHSRKHLALGRRFFALLVVPESSPFIGAAIEQTRVPGVSWKPV
jgi:hypothetical protein